MSDYLMDGEGKITLCVCVCVCSHCSEMGLFQGYQMANTVGWELDDGDLSTVRGSWTSYASLNDLICFLCVFYFFFYLIIFYFYTPHTLCLFNSTSWPLQMKLSIVWL